MTEEKAEHVLVLIPCFNEAGRIGRVVASVKSTLPHAHVVTVDDASGDGSAHEARSAGAVVLSHPTNLGYGAALETGYRYAVLHGYDTVLQMDADGQHPADQLPKLLSALREGGAHIVLGSRYCCPAAAKTVPPVRRFAHGLLSRILLVLTGLRLTDPTSGFQALDSNALDLFASGVFPCDYPDSDVILMAHMAGLTIREIPVTMLPRASGKSMHSGLKPIYYAMKMLLAMAVVLLNFQAWHGWRKRHGRKTKGTEK